MQFAKQKGVSDQAHAYSLMQFGVSKHLNDTNSSAEKQYYIRKDRLRKFENNQLLNKLEYYKAIGL